MIVKMMRLLFVLIAIATVPSVLSFITPGLDLHGRSNPRAVPQASSRSFSEDCGNIGCHHMVRNKDHLKSELDNASKGAENELRAKCAVCAASLIILGQAMNIAPSEATTYGGFSASVNPAKTLPCVETTRRVGDSAAQSSCQPPSFISSLKADFPSKDEKALQQVNTGKPRNNDQLLQHQKLLDDLAEEPEWFNFASAFFASAVSTLVIHPLDTVKVRLMTEKNGKRSDSDDGEGLNTDSALYDGLATVSTGPEETWGSAFNGENSKPSSKLSVAPPAPQSALLSSTALAAVAATANEKLEQKSIADQPLANIRSLYDGVLPNLFKEAPPSALYLGLYESSMIFLKQFPFFAEHNLLTYLLAGAVGEMAGSIVRAPAEAVKCRVQNGMNLGSAMNTVFMTKDGRSNTYTAWSSSIFRDVPAGAVQIAIFEVLKTFIIASSFNIEVDNLIGESILGGIGGGIGAFLTTPSDRVTTMIMSSEEELSVVEGFKRIWAEYGVSGFFIGSFERSSYWFFAIGIFLSVYCATRQAAIPFFL